MATSNTRSEYIKQILADKESVTEAMQSVVRDSLRSMLDESTKKSLRHIISEGADTSEDEVDDPTLETPEKSKKEDEVEATDDLESVEDTENKEEKDNAEEADVDDVWKDLEDLEGEDGVYDLTNVDKDQLVKVFKALGPDDNVIVTKQDNGTVKLTDNNTEQTYIIDIDGTLGEEGEDYMGESVDDFGHEKTLRNQITGMTLPSNDEPADPKKTYSMDSGVPKGAYKPFAQSKGKQNPFDEETEEPLFELELEEGEAIDETMTTQEQGAYNRGTGMVHTNNNAKAAKGRNSTAAGERVHGTTQNSYSESDESMKTQMEAIRRKASAILDENKQLKELLPQLVKKLQEHVVINKNMGNIVRVITENTTTAAEKREIITRFSAVNTCEASDNLYNTICEEMKRKPSSAVNLGPNIQIAESVATNKQSDAVNEPMYQSKDMRSLMERIERVYKRH